MILFDKKLPVTSPALKGFEKTVAKYNTDGDPSTISLRELDRPHRKLEAQYKDVENWGPQDSPQWQARYEAARIEVVAEQISLANRSPLENAVGRVIGTAILALGWYPH